MSQALDPVTQHHVQQAAERLKTEFAGIFSVEFTHQVADGMHGAIVKARKTKTPEAKGLPIIRPATQAGCC